MFFKFLKYLFRFFLVLVLFMIIINVIVIYGTKDKIFTTYSSDYFDNVDCILILGAGIYGNYPTLMLKSRLDDGLVLYKINNKKILVSGDHVSDSHDEVSVMKDYLIGHGVPSQEVLMDHFGISTYDSLYRAKEIYQVKSVVIVTQKYHLYRSLYVASSLGLEAYGYYDVDASFSNQFVRDVREFFARVKDFFKSIINPEAIYLGDSIPIDSNGDVTNGDY